MCQRRYFISLTLLLLVLGFIIEVYIAVLYKLFSELAHAFRILRLRVVAFDAGASTFCVDLLLGDDLGFMI